MYFFYLNKNWRMLFICQHILNNDTLPLIFPFEFKVSFDQHWFVSYFHMQLLLTYTANSETASQSQLSCHPCHISVGNGWKMHGAGLGTLFLFITSTSLLQQDTTGSAFVWNYCLPFWLSLRRQPRARILPDVFYNHPEMHCMLGLTFHILSVIILGEKRTTVKIMCRKKNSKKN